ncbi:MAG: SpoIIE family protein phosphatase [Pirellulales bacterium]|nr:SpoIIE family protein phosphatase [Pirellulales bacterium]
MAVLKVLKGLNPGQVFSLDDERSVLGRHPDCTIVLDEGAVSRQHAQIVRVGEDFFVEDLHSRNGTLLNGALVEGRQLLSDTDKVKICDWLFSFHEDRLPAIESSEPAGFSLGPDVGQAFAPHTMLVDEDQATSTIMSKLDLSSGESGLRMSIKPEAKLRALLEITLSLGSALKLDEVLGRILDGLFKIFVQADRGFIVLAEPGGPLVPKAVKQRGGDTGETIRISRTIVRRVMESREAILSADAASDERFDMSQSIADFRIRSMMCAPLLDGAGESLGVLQIDTLDQRSRFRQEDLDVLASVARQAAIAVENAQLHAATLKQQAMQRDLELAHKVQQGFLPAAPPRIGGYDFFDFYEPANLLGGDYYDYVQLGENRVAVIVADVAGKGIPAALLVAKLSAEIRFALASETDPALAVARMNASFIRGGWEDRFVTLIVAVLDTERNVVQIVNAGHMPPYLRHRDRRVEAIGGDAAGLPIGVDVDFDYEMVAVPLRSGDSLTFFTDGISEAMNAENELYGLERLEVQLHETTSDGITSIGRGVLDDVKKFVGRTPQRDDMCLVCFGRS